MKKYPIENFYIGKLNILFPPTNLLAAACGAPPTKEEVDVLNLVSNTAWNGAFHIDDSYGGTTRLSNGFRVASLLTLYYKNGEDEYYCLHKTKDLSEEEKKNLIEDLSPNDFPTICNVFYEEFLEGNICFDLIEGDINKQREEMIKLIQHFCFWLNKNGYTIYKLSISNN